MQFPPSNPVRALPASAAAWSRVAVATRDGHYAAWGAGVLVNVHSSKLAVALPLVKCALRNGQRHLPLNVVVYLLGQLGLVEDDSLAIDLASGISPATLASFEAWSCLTSSSGWFTRDIDTPSVRKAISSLRAPERAMPLDFGDPPPAHMTCPTAPP